MAAQRGDGRALEALDRLQKTNDPAALRAYYLLMLDYVSTNDVFTSRNVNKAVAYLEKNYPQDPQVLTALGLVYAFGYANNYHDPKKAKADFDQAIALGSDDAKAFEADMVAVGYGTKRNVPLALEMLKPLLDKNNAIAFTYYAYYHYWGLRTDDKISQDPAVAFMYAVKAQSAGSIWASSYLEMAYGFGVGTPKNYALAAKFTRIEANNHMIEYADAEHQIRKYLAFVDYK